jgi:hypothetical protein
MEITSCLNLGRVIRRYLRATLSSGSGSPECGELDNDAAQLHGNVLDTLPVVQCNQLV